MVSTVIVTRNGRYVKQHEDYEKAMSYVRAFTAVTNDARWEIVPCL